MENLRLETNFICEAPTQIRKDYFINSFLELHLSRKIMEMGKKYFSSHNKITAQPTSLVLKDRVGKSNNVALLTLNRPEVFNALSEQLLKELNMALEDCSADESIVVVVLTGSHRAFSGTRFLDFSSFDTGSG
uniref:Enoyl-CoA hydratase n=1 Tax=Parascaris univalens TaxID=6257 RepID=A0A914ZSA6_PARUN